MLSRRLLYVCFSFFGLIFTVLSANAQGFSSRKSLTSESYNYHYTIKPNNLQDFIGLLTKGKIDLQKYFLNKESGLVHIEMSGDHFTQFLPFIEAYDVRGSRPTEESFLPDFFPEVNAIKAAKQRFPEYFTYEGTLSVKENDADPNDIDTKGRVYPSILSSGIAMAHATDMATIIAGNGSTYYTSEGIVPQASISTTNFNNLLPDPIDYFINNGIHIQNHSYGLEVEDYYGLEAEAYDRQVYENDDLLHVFSSGNKGGESALFSAYADLENYSNLTGTFKHAKNVLTIGAIDSFSVLGVNSSRGPAYDGRIKPELVAYGYNGTSDAAAIVSGCAAVVRNALEIEKSVKKTSLIKALLIASADDVGTIGPDFQTGYGRVNLLKCLDVIKKGNFLIGVIPSDDILEFEIDVKSPFAKFVLSWTDPPAKIENEHALVNDVDLQIIDSAGAEYLPFQLKHLPEEIAMGMLLSTGRDSINNTEVIQVNEPGKYLIRVKAGTLTNGVQEFSIAYYDSSSEQFQFVFPYEGANVEVGEKVEVLLNTSEGEAITNVEFDEQDKYEYPEEIEFSEPSAKVEGSSSSSFGSFTTVNFTVSDIPQVEVLWMCEDSLSFGWVAGRQESDYQILKYSGDSLVVIDSTRSSHFTVPTKELGLYAIRKRLAENVYGPHSLILNTSKANTGCLYNIFEGRKLEEEVELSVAIVENPPYHSIVVEKKIMSEWVKFAELDTEIQEQTVNDVNPIKGVNQYRLAFSVNEIVVYSDLVEIVFVPDDEVLVFPSLTTQENGFDIVQGEYRELDFYVFNAIGQLVVKEELLTAYDFLTFEGLPSGIYFYYVLSEDQKVTSGKVIVHRN